jgi:hypothetical protein
VEFKQEKINIKDEAQKAGIEMSGDARTDAAEAHIAHGLYILGRLAFNLELKGVEHEEIAPMVQSFSHSMQGVAHVYGLDTVRIFKYLDHFAEMYGCKDFAKEETVQI